MKRTISTMVGKGSVTHNSRTFTAENVDSNRTHLNIDYCNKPIKKVYHEMFDEALKQHNDKQKRKDRKISDYYKHNRRARRACEDSPRRILSGFPRAQSLPESVLCSPSYGRSNAAYPYRLCTVHHRQ